MRWLVAIAILGACGSDESIVKARVVHGWEGKLDFLLGPTHCVPEVGDPRLAPAGDHWRAIAVGHTRVPCHDGTVELDILDPARLAIDAPAVLGASPEVVSLVAYDGFGRELPLGDAAVTWTVTGAAAERSSGCEHHDDMDFLCGAIESVVRRPAVTYVAATSAGSATITARFGELVASRTLAAQR